MALVLYIVAGLVILTGLVVAGLAPTEFMGAREALYARLVLAAPALLVGLILAALAALLTSLKNLERIGRELLARSGTAAPPAVRAPEAAPDLAAPLPEERLAPAYSPLAATPAPAPAPSGAAMAGIGAAGLAAGALAATAAPARAAPAPAGPEELHPAAPEPAQALERGWTLELPSEPAPAEQPAEPTGWPAQPEPAAERWPDLAVPARAEREPEPEAEAEPEPYDADSQAARVAAALEAVLIADRAADARLPHEEDDDRQPALPDREIEPGEPQRRIEPVLRMEDLLDDPEPAPPPRDDDWFETRSEALPPVAEPAPEPESATYPDRAPEPVRVELPPLRPWFGPLPDEPAEPEPSSEEPAEAPAAPPEPEPEPVALVPEREAVAPAPEPEPVAPEPEPVALAPEPVPVPMPAPAPTAAPYIAPEPAAGDPSGTPPAPEPMAEPRPPTVADILARGGEDPPAPEAPAPRIVREGQFAGRRYRMFENGSLEIDTDQSTIRFGSLDEFRAFVAAASRKQPEPTG